MKLQVSNTNAPTWRDITIHAHLPEKLKNLETMAKNLWWVWNSSGKTFSVTSTMTCGVPQAKIPSCCFISFQATVLTKSLPAKNGWSVSTVSMRNSKPI